MVAVPRVNPRLWRKQALRRLPGSPGFHGLKSEVIPGLLAILFGETAEEYLVDAAHFQRRDFVGAEFEFLVLVENGSFAAKKQIRD
jgi:hypothetical protein